MENYELVKKSDLPIFTSSWFFNLGSIHVEENQHQDKATFDLFVRELPDCRNYLVSSGLKSVVDFLLDFKFTREQIEYFRDSVGLSVKAINYYKKLRFSGDLWAIPEGALVFPNEPVIRITAPIVEAEIIERYLINTVMSNMVFASKISRFVNAIKKYDSNIVTGLNYTRAHGVQASLTIIRNAKMVGVDVISSPYLLIINKKKLQSVSTTHAFISSFDSEEEALKIFCKHLGKNVGYWLVDTFNAKEGTKKFIKIVSELKRLHKPYPLFMHLDSGNLGVQSRWARKALDKAGLKEIKIAVASNLDEYSVAKFHPGQMVCNLMLGGTELTSSSDAPKLEVVYKLAELEKNGRIIPKMKLASKKLSLPGKKQVFRISKNGRHQYDVIGLSNEKIKNSEALLKPIIKKGKLIKSLPTESASRAYHEKNKKGFSDALWQVNKKVAYEVKISDKLKTLMLETRKKLSDK